MCKDCGLPPFRYQDLRLEPKSFSIRLLKLHPAGVQGADIVIELVTTDSDNPSYDALSWCWGKGGPTRPVRARSEGGDHCLRISTNLESALRHLRLPDRYRILWIDAICIDQSNSMEKNRQVPMMSDIYGKAQRVCVWLGDSDDSSVKAINFVKDHVLDLHDFDNICQDDKYAEGWIALVQFMERPWFSRRWVIQEIALANQTTATIICGQDTISWAEFSEAVSLFDGALTGPLDLSKLKFPHRNNVSYSTRYAPALGAIRLVKATNELFRTSFYDGIPSALRSLEYLVSTFTIFDLIPDGVNMEGQATLFDHLPLVRNVMKTWMESHIVRRAFRVDYDAPIIEVYKQFISFSVSKAQPSRALDIICRPWAPELRNVEFPSWISTLANATYKLVDQNALGQRLVRRNPDSLVGNPDSATYNASRNIGPPKSVMVFPYWKSVDRSMFLRGFVLDEVRNSTYPSQLGHIPLEWVAMGNWDPKYDEPPEEFWRTLVADRSPRGRDPLLFYPRACREVFQHSIDDTLDTSMLINHGSSIIADFLKRVQAVIWNRRLMRTKRSWLGLAPKATRDGDLVCILYGCSVPVILRKVQKTSSEIELELKDHETRKADAVLYIARKLADYARRRRAAREEYSTSISSDKSRTHDSQGVKERSPQMYQPDEEKKVAQSSSEHNLDSNPSSDRHGKRRYSESNTNGHDSKRFASDHQQLKYVGPDASDVYYILIGECYVHGMMNGEARIFRSRYNAGKPISERIMAETFELR
ncbi:HET-domain-containing protein [Lindgomyces ingoldianus]|uniref:HET-domain-containing protein n=1 Tax=Lindgomyces ingoldianus TaxID=673940 RepID=A0ACB6QHP7_9PLEO|nr:HET-domain-containing protein [Lindgomyces ingoldianus]KAF2466544.1 HET-domain-containing protein [Lindgomyces ingoldianus]